VIDPAYPIGRREAFTGMTLAEREERLAQMLALSGELHAAVADLSDEQLDTPYREGGWTVRQVVHHLADAHMTGFLRCKLALTEDNPVAKPWSQPAFGALPDASRAPIGPSLTLLEGLQERYVALFRGLSDEQWGRTYVPPAGGQHTLAEALHVYSWHGRHHTAQITNLRSSRGW
jgi:uncharacterized damage-inducible protein DinB